MIKHIVFWTLAEANGGANKVKTAERLKGAIEDLRGCVPGIVHLEVGVNTEPSEDAWDVALYSEFETAADLEAYQAHPAHEAVRELVGKVREERAVVDYETETSTVSALARAHAETRAAFENRALVYAHLFDALADDVGELRATELMKRAIYRRGVEIGARYRESAEAGDLAAVGRIFCEGSPCGGALFEPAVDELGTEEVVLRMTACPLLDAWRAAGLAPERIDLLCEIAAAVDEGTFEGAGLELSFLDRQARPRSDRCLLRVRLRDA